jgi:ABC-type branched-subunit amino acid transport system substrate-binding protein
MYDPAATDLSPQAAIIRDAKPDVIVNFGYPADTARALRALRQLDVKAKVISSRTIILAATCKLAAEACDGVLVTNTVDPDRADVKKFIDTYTARFGPVKPTMYPVTGYDTGKLAFRAMEQPKVLEALKKGSLPEARQALRDALEATGTSFKGLQGHQGTSYVFGPKQHNGSPDEKWYTFLEATDKGAKLVKPIFKPVP